MEDAIEGFASRAHNARTELICEIAPEVPRIVSGDPLRVHQVLANLPSNAIKFSCNGDVRLIVEVQKAPPVDAIRFEVHDQGQGLSGEQCTRLFSAFTQADTSTTRRFGGTGLGLAISKQLTEMMGGRIGVRTAVGEGSTFHFTVPFDASAARATGWVPEFLRPNRPRRGRERRQRPGAARSAGEAGASRDSPEKSGLGGQLALCPSWRRRLDRGVSRDGRQRRRGNPQRPRGERPPRSEDAAADAVSG